MNAPSSIADWRALFIEDEERYHSYIDERISQIQRLFGEDSVVSDLGSRSLVNSEAPTAEDKKSSWCPFISSDLFDVKDSVSIYGSPFPDVFEYPADSDSLLIEQLRKTKLHPVAKFRDSQFGFRCDDDINISGDPYTSSEVLGYSIQKGLFPVAFGLDSCARIRHTAKRFQLYGFRHFENDLARDGAFPIVPEYETIGFLTNSICDLRRTLATLVSDSSALAKPHKLKGFFLDDPIRVSTENTFIDKPSFVRKLSLGNDIQTENHLRKSFQEARFAFDVLRARRLHAVHRYWMEDYESDYHDTLKSVVKFGENISPIALDKAESIQLQLRDAMAGFFSDYDYLILPIGSEPDLVGSNSDNIVSDLATTSDIVCSLAKLPALVLPSKTSDAKAYQILFRSSKVVNAFQLIKSIED